MSQYLKRYQYVFYAKCENGLYKIKVRRKWEIHFFAEICKRREMITSALNIRARVILFYHFFLLSFVRLEGEQLLLFRCCCCYTICCCCCCCCFHCCLYCCYCYYYSCLHCCFYCCYCCCYWCCYFIFCHVYMTCVYSEIISMKLSNPVGYNLRLLHVTLKSQLLHWQSNYSC